MLATILVAIPIFIALALRLWPHTPIGKLVILKTPEPVEDTSDEQAHDELQDLIGLVGVTVSPLMPYGFVRLAGRSYNAVCDSGFIEVNEKVLVTAIQQRNLVVAITSQSPTHASEESEPAARQKNNLDRRRKSWDWYRWIDLSLHLLLGFPSRGTEANFLRQRDPLDKTLSNGLVSAH